MSVAGSLLKGGIAAVHFKHHGGFDKTQKGLMKSMGMQWVRVLDRYGQEGVLRLMAATPVDTGKTADSWTYELVQNGSSVSVIWSNTNVNNGVNIALILDIGHGTRNGGYVVGLNYIDPALQPIFEAMASAAWREVNG